MSIKLTEEMRQAWYLHDLDEFRKILDRDYVTRWGTVSIPVPREMQHTAEYSGYLKEMIKQRAEYMGATVVDIDHPVIEPFWHEFADTVTYTWKVRRD